MKTINNIQSFTGRLLSGELSLKEAMGIFMVLVSVISFCIYAFAPQSFNQ
ncbi:MAG: hypothetical protein JWQ79_2601 [Mucilaginibacter sp.]|jgi:hypothetical protein|nr:hypothetical protein [Mucilaginibacter sp.]